MLADKFYLGNDNSFISGSDGNIKVSGSNVDILTEKFFLGISSTHISGSNGKIGISGSNVSIETNKSTEFSKYDNLSIELSSKDIESGLILSISEILRASSSRLAS